MLVTLLGIVTLVIPMQPEKAEFPMLVTPSGIVVLLHPAISVLVFLSIIALQLLRESYILFSSLTTMLVRPLQPSNALCPMLITLLGISMFVRLLQPSNALCPMLITLLGIVTFVSPMQLENA